MRKSLLAVILFLLIPAQTFALPTPGPKANPPGDLSVMVVASESVQYLEDWVNPSMVNRVSISRVTKVKPDQVAYCGFIITGLTPSPEPTSTIQYSVGFRLIGPSGDILFQVPEYAKGQLNNPDKPILVMADPALDLILEATDPAGAYRLEAIATDLFTGKRARDSYEITLVK